MNKILIIVALVLGSIIGIALVGGLVFGLKRCQAVEQFVEDTIVKATKHVYSYEEFSEKYQKYLSYDQQICDVQDELKRLERDNLTDSKKYGRLSVSLDGIKAAKLKAAKDYNAMSHIAYREEWGKKGLPDTIEIKGMENPK